MLLTYGPHASTPHNQGSGAKEKDGLYAGDVIYVDHLVGKVEDTIDELSLRKERFFYRKEQAQLSPESSMAKIIRKAEEARRTGDHMFFLLSGLLS